MAFLANLFGSSMSIFHLALVPCLSSSTHPALIGVAIGGRLALKEGCLGGYVAAREVHHLLA